MNGLIANLPLILFVIFLANYAIGAFFISYHLLKFGIDAKTKTATTVFIAGFVFLLFSAFYFFFKVEWSGYIETLPFLNIL